MYLKYCFFIILNISYSYCKSCDFCCNSCRKNNINKSDDNEKYIKQLMETVEFVNDFTSLKDEDKKIKFINIKKPIEWSANYCTLISIIQALFAVPIFFEYIANSKFENEKQIKLQQLLLDMIENENNPETKTFSKNKFSPYYSFFMKKMISYSHIKFCRYSDFLGYQDCLRYFNIIKGSCPISYENITNSSIIYFSKNSFGKLNLLTKRENKFYNNGNRDFSKINDEQLRTKYEDYYKKRNLISILFNKLLGEKYMNIRINKNIKENKEDKIFQSGNFDCFKLFFFVENNKNEFRNSLFDVYDGSEFDFDKIYNNITNLLNNYNFELNSIILADIDCLDGHAFNINYNKNEDALYSYNTLGVKNYKKIDIDEIIRHIDGSALVHLFISVSKK